MTRGGRRAGKPGSKYPNRSDLSLAPRTAPVTPIPGQGYGKQTQQVQMQQEGAAQVAQIAERRPPLPAFDRPTERPQEPITAGLPSGPGPGPEVLGFGQSESMVDELKALYRLYPSRDLLRLIYEALDE